MRQGHARGFKLHVCVHWLSHTLMLPAWSNGSDASTLFVGLFVLIGWQLNT